MVDGWASVRLGWLAFALAIVASFGVSGCGSSGTAADQAPPPGSRGNHVALCELIRLPLRAMRPRHLTFREVAAGPASEDAAVGQMIGLLFERHRRELGAFRPVLSFLAKRGAAEVDRGGGALPSASKAVLRNASELDAFVRAGGCD